MKIVATRSFVTIALNYQEKNKLVKETLSTKYFISVNGKCNCLDLKSMHKF